MVICSGHGYVRCHGYVAGMVMCVVMIMFAVVVVRLSVHVHFNLGLPPRDN